MAPKSMQSLRNCNEQHNHHRNTTNQDIKPASAGCRSRLGKTALLALLLVFTAPALVKNQAFAETTTNLPSSQAENPLYRESLALIEARDYQSAINSLTSFLNKNPSSDEAFFLRGKAYHELGKIAEASSDYKKAIELNPLSYKAYNNEGLIYGQLKKFELATKSFTKAIANNPQPKEAYNNRGVARAASGDPSGAIDDFTKSIALDNKYLEPVLNRSFVFEMQGKLNKACQDWQTAGRMGSVDAQIWHKAQCKA